MGSDLPRRDGPFSPCCLAPQPRVGSLGDSIRPDVSACCFALFVVTHWCPGSPDVLPGFLEVFRRKAAANWTWLTHIVDHGYSQNVPRIPGFPHVSRLVLVVWLSSPLLPLVSLWRLVVSRLIASSSSPPPSPPSPPVWVSSGVPPSLSGPGPPTILERSRGECRHYVLG